MALVADFTTIPCLIIKATLYSNMKNVQDTSNIKQLNIGCGSCPTKGWVNYDSNIFIFFCKIPLTKSILAKLPFIPKAIIEFIGIVKTFNIKFANAAKTIPEKDDSVKIIYSSHMLEHFEKNEAIIFLKEAKRVLAKGGIIRIVVPNLDYFIQKYLQDNDSSKFIKDLCMSGVKPKTLIKKLQYLIMGHGWHHEMYNEKSLIRLIEDAGFIKIKILKPGETMINNINGLNLREHCEESITLEAYKK